MLFENSLSFYSSFIKYLQLEHMDKTRICFEASAAVDLQEFPQLETSATNRQQHKNGFWLLF